jgi:hypothetical protein
MRLLPILTAATIGLFATAAAAQQQNMDTSRQGNPNYAPGASEHGKGKVKRPTAAEIRKMDTTDPNSAPRAATGRTGKKRMTTGAGQNMDTSNAGNPNRPGGASVAGANAGTGNPSVMHKKVKKHSKHKKNPM